VCEQPWGETWKRKELSTVLLEPFPGEENSSYFHTAFNRLVAADISENSGGLDREAFLLHNSTATTTTVVILIKRKNNTFS
jgi:hypothetical protein